jgi:hypothetical protein
MIEIESPQVDAVKPHYCYHARNVNRRPFSHNVYIPANPPEHIQQNQQFQDVVG